MWETKLEAIAANSTNTIYTFLANLNMASWFALVEPLVVESIAPS